MTVECIIEDDRWQAAGIETLATRATDAALAHLKLDPAEWDIALLACDDTRIAALNEGFRDKAQATNVLSWPSEERGSEDEGTPPEPPSGDPELGDIAIAFDTCAREAAEAGLSLESHATHLIVHGTLHLLGYDHIRDGDGDLMESTEIAILADLGIGNPYGGHTVSRTTCDGKD